MKQAPRLRYRNPSLCRDSARPTHPPASPGRCGSHIPSEAQRGPRGPHPLSTCVTGHPALCPGLQPHPGTAWPPELTGPAGTPALLLPDSKLLLQPAEHCPVTANVVSALGGTQALNPWGWWTIWRQAMAVAVGLLSHSSIPKPFPTMA